MQSSSVVMIFESGSITHTVLLFLAASTSPYTTLSPESCLEHSSKNSFPRLPIHSGKRFQTCLCLSVHERGPILWRIRIGKKGPPLHPSRQKDQMGRKAHPEEGPARNTSWDGVKKSLVLIYIKPNLVLSHFRWLWWRGGGGCQKIKVAQNDPKHILVLEFLKSDEIFKIL